MCVISIINFLKIYLFIFGRGLSLRSLNFLRCVQLVGLISDSKSLLWLSVSVSARHRADSLSRIYSPVDKDQDISIFKILIQG